MWARGEREKREEQVQCGPERDLHGILFSPLLKGHGTERDSHKLFGGNGTSQTSHCPSYKDSPCPVMLMINRKDSNATKL